MKNLTYAQFEDEHRGSSDAITKRLSVYIPVLKEFKKFRSNARLIDLGCGRGEFLQITSGLLIDSFGIDTNEEMLASAKQLDLRVKKTDALEFLSSEKDNSFDILTAFHLAEHFKLSKFEKLVNEIKRVLRPGGLIILETPNPENVIVSTCNFYMDMTHVRPLPPQLLEFIFKNLKFNYINLWGLNSSKNFSSEPVALIDVLGGVSPDYALLALKSSTELPSKGLIKELNVSRGVKLNEIAALYEKRWSGEIESVVKRIEMGQGWVSDELSVIKNGFENFHSEIQSMHSEIRSEILSIQEQTHFYQLELQRVTNSRSWRITYPLRLVGKVARRTKTLIKNFFFDFQNLPIKIFLKNYRGKIARKLLPRFFNNSLINKLGSTNSFVSGKEKKLLSILEKIKKEK